MKYFLFKVYLQLIEKIQRFLLEISLFHTVYVLIEDILIVVY